MGADIHMRAEVRRDGEWTAVGEVFPTEREWSYKPATRENMEALDDGRLLYALMWELTADATLPERQARHAKKLAEILAEGREPLGSQKEPPGGPYYSVLTDRVPARVIELAVEADRRHRESFEPLGKLRDELWEIHFLAVVDELGIDRETWAAVEAERKEKGEMSGDNLNLYWRVHEQTPMRRDLWEKYEAAQRDARSQSVYGVKLKPSDRAALIDAVLHYVETEDRDMDLRVERMADDPELKTTSPYEGRNYNVFSMLANVRNGDSARGEPDRVEPIDTPRGIPDDCSPEVGQFMRDGEHSHSYLTLAELLAQDWDNQRVGGWGVVREDAFHRFEETGEIPRDVFKSCAGGGVRTFTPEGYRAWVERGRPYFPPLESRHFLDPEVFVTPELLTRAMEGDLDVKDGHAAWAELHDVGMHMLDQPEKIMDPTRTLASKDEETMPVVMVPQDDPDQAPIKSPYVKIAWGESWAEAAGDFYSRTMPALRALGEPEDVRICFWFDS